MELVLPIYNAHPYCSLKDLGRKVHIIHGKTRYIFACVYLYVCTWNGLPCKRYFFLWVAIKKV